MHNGYHTISKKYRIQGAIILATIEFIIGLFIFLLIKNNYHKWTGSDSISEGSIYDMLQTKDKKSTIKHIESNTPKSVLSSGDQKNFVGIFGEIRLDSSNITTSTKDISFKIGDSIIIHADKIYYYYLLKDNLNNGFIDKGLLNYIIRNTDRDDEYVTKELNFLLPNISADKTNAYNKTKTIIDHIKESNRDEIINTLQKIESEYLSLIQTNQEKKLLDHFNFTSSNAFTYIRERLAVDSTNMYKDTITLASKKFQIDEDLIRSVIFTEQLRGLTTYRGILKNLLYSNKFLMVMNQWSYGLGGIKEKTAIEIENRYKTNKESIYNDIFIYTDSQNISYQRTNRLTSTKDYYYQIMYVAGALAMYKDQWAQAGYDISQQIGILSTLYNIGYKEPNSQPEIGGANITLNGDSISFGKLSTSIFYLLKSDRFSP